MLAHRQGRIELITTERPALEQAPIVGVIATDLVSGQNTGEIWPLPSLIADAFFRTADKDEVGKLQPRRLHRIVETFLLQAQLEQPQFYAR